MTRINVHRSALRQFLMGVAGLLLLFAAIDIVWAHRVSLEPERDDGGNFTRRGESRLRQDIVVGTTFILIGGSLVAVAFAGLMNARPVAEIDDEGIMLRIAGPRQSIYLGWEDIAEVRSAREPGDGTGARPLLLVRLRYPDFWPREYWGARREGDWLMVDADSWSTPPEDIVVHARMGLSAFRRGAVPPAERET